MTDLPPTTPEEREEWRHIWEAQQPHGFVSLWPDRCTRLLADLDREIEKVRLWIETSAGWMQRAERAERERDAARWQLQRCVEAGRALTTETP